MGGKSVLKYEVEEDTLVICQVERKDMLPKDCYSKWDDVHNLEAKSDVEEDATQEPTAVVRNI